MPLSNTEAVARFKEMMKAREAESGRLDRIHDYLRDDPERRLQGLPSAVPQEVHRLARLSRVNLLKFVVNSRVQSMYVDGYRAPRVADDAPVWDVWQANGMDARQIGVHRAALGYGASYVTVLPGEPAPVMRGASPRRLTCVYGEDDMWPAYALEKRNAVSGELWRLIDSDAVYWITKDRDSDEPTVVATEEHGAGVTPVVRFRDTIDLDDPVVGVVEPLIPLQDQINITTFGLMVSQHYGAFRQRYILGWAAENEEQKLRASASKLWTFEETPDEITIGEFEQNDLSGYIESRKSAVELLSSISQTPAHELLGQLVNLSAEALAAAEASKRRAITENQTSLGESHEQALGLAARLQGSDTDPAAFVRWRDTESRSLAQLVDALGKATQLLGIPPQALWDHVADAMGVSQQELETWKSLAAEGDALGRLEAMLDRQAQGDPVGVN